MYHCQTPFFLFSLLNSYSLCIPQTWWKQNFFNNSSIFCYKTSRSDSVCIFYFIHESSLKTQWRIHASHVKKLQSCSNQEDMQPFHFTRSHSHETSTRYQKTYMNEKFTYPPNMVETKSFRYLFNFLLSLWKQLSNINWKCFWTL